MDDQYIPCQEEIDFLRFCKLDWIEPMKRHSFWQHSVRRFDVHQVAKS
jgi:hypothetical protein